VSDYTSGNGITLDYKDHIVLEWATIDEEDKPTNNYKLIPFEMLITDGKDKIKLNSTSGPIRKNLKYPQENTEGNNLLTHDEIVSKSY